MRKKIKTINGWLPKNKTLLCIHGNQYYTFYKNHKLNRMKARFLSIDQWLLFRKGLKKNWPIEEWPPKKIKLIIEEG